MSDLGAIFHVKKAGVQYDAHAYTTTNECPEPNLKIKFKGQQAYIKLGAKGSGDVPCYVKKKDGSVFQVIKQATPTGSISIKEDIVTKFTVPSGISVVMITGIENGRTVGASSYVGVTPGKTYSLYFRIKPADTPPIPEPISMLVNYSNNKIWNHLVDIYADSFNVSWSPEINKKKPTVMER